MERGEGVWLEGGRELLLSLLPTEVGKSGGGDGDLSVILAKVCKWVVGRCGGLRS